MARIAIGIGTALIVLALVGYVFAAGPALSDGSTYRSWTALIPAFAGVPIALCGLIALNPAHRKHAMHVAVIFGLLGFIAPLGRLIPALARGDVPRPLVLVRRQRAPPREQLIPRLTDARELPLVQHRPRAFVVTRIAQV